MQKTSKLDTGQAAGEQGVMLIDISKFTGYNQDIVAWAIAKSPELANLGTGACLMDVKSEDEALVEVREPYELR